MPIILKRNGKRMLSTLEERITKMTLPEMVLYEAQLWEWMDKCTVSVSSIATQLNAIHREVEWRLDKDWSDHAPHTGRRPRTLAQRTR